MLPCSSPYCAEEHSHEVIPGGEDVQYYEQLSSSGRFYAGPCWALLPALGSVLWFQL